MSAAAAEAGGSDTGEQLNPFVRLGFVAEGEQAGIRVVTLRRGHGWTSALVERATQPRLFALLHGWLTGADDVELDADDAALDELRAIGMWVAPEEVPNEVRFAAPLDDVAVDADVTGGDDAALVVQPGLAWASPRPLDVPPPGDVVWLHDARSGVTMPWVPGALRPALAACTPGQAPPPFDRSLRRQLRSAGVLVAPAAEAERAAARDAELAAAARAFAADGYATVPRLLPPGQLAALQRYYRALLDERCVRFGDPQVARRFAHHNEPMARLIASALTDVTSRVVGRALELTYAYFASYREGAELVPHVDRAQCAFSLSFLVDYAPAPADGRSPWPLWVARGDAGTPLYQCIGDGIVYLGCERRHWREPLGPGQQSTHLFLHYVERDCEDQLA